ncbi:MAG: hypothetical protein MJ158_04040, partial [Alphaproteobacteria bacterium]|nr:hypothetical protein [Alphaproteobacteria bacterium]
MKKWLNIILILICVLGISGWFVFRVRHVENIVTKFADGNYRILWNDYILPDIRDPEERMFFAYMVNSSDKPLDTRLNLCFLKQA